jgi:hypothetical protein
MVYKQNDGATDFSSLDLTPNSAWFVAGFDLEGMASTYNLSLIDVNYWRSRGTIWSSFIMRWKMYLYILFGLRF